MSLDSHHSSHSWNFPPKHHLQRLQLKWSRIRWEYLLMPSVLLAQMSEGTKGLAQGDAEGEEYPECSDGSGVEWELRELSKVPGQWLSWESVLGDEAWEEGCRMVALRREDLIASLPFCPGTVTSHNIHSHNVLREDLSTESNPGIRGLSEESEWLPKDTEAKTLKVFPSPFSSRNPLLTFFLPLLYTWNYLLRDYLPLKLVSSIRASMVSIGLAYIPSAWSREWICVYVWVFCVSLNGWQCDACTLNFHVFMPFLLSWKTQHPFPLSPHCPQQSVLFRVSICSTRDDNLLIPKEFTTKQW